MSAGLTTDPNDPRLTKGVDEAPVNQAEVYLVLSEQERAKGFIRPVRTVYTHVGPPGPEFPMQDLTDEQRERCAGQDYVKWESYPPDREPVTGRYWTQKQLDAVGKGCGGATSMGRDLAETYARNPKFYGSTYCYYCRMHKPVDEFVWEDGSRVGS